MKWVVAVRRKTVWRLAMSAAVGIAVLLAWSLLRVADRPPTPVPPLAWLARPTGAPHLIMAGGIPAAPPDTLPAFGLALRRGATALLLPVRFTSDGEPVVFAPADLSATTEGEGPVGRLPVDQVQQLDAGYRFAGRRGDFPFRGHGLQIPQLEQVLAAFPGVPVLVDVKDPEPPPAHLQALARIVRRWEGEALVLFRLPSATAAKAFREAVPGSPAVSTVAEAAGFRRLARLGLGFLARPSYQVLWLAPEAGRAAPEPEVVRAAHQRGLVVLAGPVGERVEADRLAGAGVDALLVSGPAASR